MLRRTYVLVLAYVVTVTGCYDVSAHDVRIESDCNGEERSATVHFDDFDFHTSCTGDLFSGWCATTVAKGVKLDGNLEIASATIEGTESFGQSSYRVYFDQPEVMSEEVPYDPTNPWSTRLIECQWYAFEDDPQSSDVGTRLSCYFSDCTAKLTVMD